MTDDTRTRVAILGGGLGGMTAAYYLSCTPELRQRFRVTVYQQGWRLGGKAASGRDREKGDRILEHGLHILMGFYENTFSMMRRVYDEWATTPDNPFQSWSDAFTPRSRVTLQEKRPDGWQTWTLEMPPRPGTPGDGDAPIDLPKYLERLLVWILEQIQDAIGDALEDHADHIRDWPGWITARLDEIADLAALPGELVERFMPPAAKAVLQLIENAIRPDDVETGDAVHAAHLLVDELEDWLEALHDAMSFADEELRRIYMLARLAFAVARGMLADVLPYGRAGFARIDHLDFKDWLIRHGADTEDVYWSAPVQAFYDLAFAFMDGRTGSIQDAQVAAGAALHSLLAMTLDYKGAPLWEMNAGMGDTIFSPLYEVCRGNGVEFEFFSRIENLGLSETGRSIAHIDVRRQARIKPDGDGRRAYEPLFDVKGLPCWPSEPFWDQLENGEHLRDAGVNFESAWDDTEVETYTLQHGADFDLAVLAIPPGALPLCAGELIDAHPAWRSMIDNVPTVATGAVQLWLAPTLEELGWTDGETVMTSYVHPLESWAEMSHLLATENWPDDKPEPHSVEYLVGAFEAPAVLPTPHNQGYPAEQKARLKTLAIAWLEEHVGHIWPDATQAGDPRALDWSTLVDWEERTGAQRFDFQYWRTNVDPSERYVLTPPGSTRFRLRADDAGFYNLFLAGDWVVTGINGGSAESAVQGGMLAARAIGGEPGVIYDPPYLGGD